MNKNDKKELVTLLTELVGDYPMNQDELGGCVWCGGSGKEGQWGYCDESYDCHMADCPWVAGNRKLNELREQI